MSYRVRVNSIRAPRVAVLMAAHDRVVTTNRALGSLIDQVTSATLHIFLVDDGSADGTGAMVKDLLGEQVTVIRGDGTWFWARSMAVAEGVARGVGGIDYFLWLNDDTFLQPGALERLIKVAQGWHDQATVVGSVVDPIQGRVLYGGINIQGPGLLRQRVVAVTATPLCVDTFHGNVVLVPKAVHEVVGGIDGEFEHAYADIDYGLRIRAFGLTSVLCEGVAATGTPNDVRTANYGPSLNLASHFRRQITRQILPVNSTIRLLRRHTGKAWPLYFAYIYLRTLAPPVTRR